MTKRLLEGYRRNKQLIAVLESQLRDMERRREKGDANPYVVSDTILDYRFGKGRPVHIIGFDNAKYARRKTALERARRQKEEVDIWIAEIEDDLTRTVFELFYQEGKSWLQISMSIGQGGNEDYPRIVLRDQYLKAQGIRL